MVNLLFPGRHHILTKFQKEYLNKIVSEGYKGKKITKIIFSITSSDHKNTRRNPIALYQRVLMIEKFSKSLNCEVKIHPITDVKTTDKFAKYIIRQLSYQGEDLDPKNTVLACSTPEVISLFKKEGFDNLGVELVSKEKYSSLRPYEVINLLVKSGKDWKTASSWKKYAAEEAVEVYLKYDLGTQIIELFNDLLLTDDAEITETRNYNTYAQGMDKNVKFKFEDIKPFVIEGKIVDMGCGTGSLIWHLANYFEESDVIGIEATRKFYEHCKLNEYPNPFVFFYRKNILDVNFKENTIDNFIYSSILHEIYSYIGVKELNNVLKNTYTQLKPNGRIIIRDVLGPKEKHKVVLMKLNDGDGKSSGSIKELSTLAKFYRFVKDFKPRKIKFKEKTIDKELFIELNFVDGYEFISKMSYVDNWDSEMHEEFGFWNFKEWVNNLEKIGFEIVEGSHAFRSEYIINNMYKGKVNFYVLDEGKLKEEKYPHTNMILCARKRNI